MTSRREIEEQLPGLLKRGVPEPPRSLDSVSIRAARIPPRRSPRRWAVPALAASTVLAVAVALALLTVHQNEDSSAVATGPHHTSGAAAVNVQRRTRAVVAVHRLSAAFSVPFSWDESHRALSKDLTLPTDDPTSYAIEHDRLWVTDGNAETAMSYLTSHLPPDVRVGTPPTYSTTKFASALFTAGGRWLQPSLYGGVEISVITERLKSGRVGADIAVSAYWLPVRTNAHTIPSSVTSATVVVRGDMTSKFRKRGRLDTSQARTLAIAINDLAVSHPVTSTCPVIGPAATITFASPAGPRTVTAMLFCNAGVVFPPTAHRLPLYLAPGHIFDTVRAMLGLPADFDH